MNKSMNKLKYDVQKMRIADIADVGMIANECGLSFWSGVDYERHLGNKDGISLIVKDSAGKVIGFLTARLIMSIIEVTDNGFNYRQCELEIYNIAVSPAHQFRGAGKILLNKFIESPTDCAEKIIWLEVRRSNVQAVDFYLSNRFITAYARKNYYSQPVEDALIMKLILNAVERD